MKVLKFGGTSVGSADRIKHVANLVAQEERVIVVLSAMSGTTNSLVEIAEYLYNENRTPALELAMALEAKYSMVVDDLLDKSSEYHAQTQEYSKERFNQIKVIIRGDFGEKEERLLLAQGELLSTHLILAYLKQIGEPAEMLPALNFMTTDERGEPDLGLIEEKLKVQLSGKEDNRILITQGFICIDSQGEISNLERGGSDYSASLIGAAVDASEIQIWTDIDGMHNNDPRIVEGTTPVRELSFDEAAELAYFGAKILHPTSILPAKLKNIPVRLLNTLNPQAQGTIIIDKSAKATIKAVAAKDDITAIQIKSGRMLLAHGFLRKIFEIFEGYSTPIDMVTTSEVGVSVTIDNDRFLQEIIVELKRYGRVNVSKNQVIVCVVGDFGSENLGFTSKVINSMDSLPIRMISYGGSTNNISFLIDKEYKKQVLKKLSEDLFSGIQRES